MSAPAPVAIVTGAGRGIGAACARELHARGYRLSLMSPSGSSVALAEELGEFGMNGSVLEASDIESLVEQTLEQHGRIDAVVNNSGRHTIALEPHGITMPAIDGDNLQYAPDLKVDLLAVPDAAWHADFDLIVLNCVRMARAVTPHMIAQGAGAFVNISGFEAAQPRQVFPLGPVRQALHGFTKNYADRYGRDGIRMNCLLPGLLDTEPLDEALARAIPMGRYGTVVEMAQTVAFLLSAESGYITGQMIVADGGANRGV